MAISTPTKLLSLEEARQRLGPNGSELTSAQKYIEVGGGPKSLPQKYHTVIDLPSSQRRSMKKSPMGWKAIFKSKTNQNKNGPKNRRIDLINQQVCICSHTQWAKTWGKNEIKMQSEEAKRHCYLPQINILFNDFLLLCSQL